MKKTQTDPVNRAVVKIVDHRKRKLVIGAVLALTILVVAGVLVWVFFFKDKTSQSTVLDESQVRTKDTIVSQEQIMQEEQGSSDTTKAAMYGNLAQSYAYTKDCPKAWENFKKASAVAPSGSEAGLKRTEEYIKEYCPQ